MPETTTITPDISVVLPTLMRPPFNKAIDRLDGAIQSIIDQNYPGQLEILIIDDQNPEPVSELLNKAGLDYDADVRFIRLGRSNGLVQALNNGLLAAKYDLIARLDDDDKWLPGKIEKQTARFINDPDLSIVATGMRRVFENKDPDDEHVRPDGWSKILHFFCDVGCPFAHGSIVARKDIFGLLGGYPQSAGVRHCEDYALWSVWVRFFKPSIIEELLFEYTVSTASISSLNAKKNQRISGKINGSFINLGINDVTPTAINKIANILGISVLQAGVMCYRLWHYRATVALPLAVVDPLQVLLVDRNVRMVTRETAKSRILQLDSLLNGFGSPKSPQKAENTVIVSVV